mmetsp:Transcript_40446/g.102360  ORF Transcript_40446/g.102360 Transcript_40446/m.102360 type:complete len:287 (-) Transcript_40446:431-1291(-)
MLRLSPPPPKPRSLAPRSMVWLIASYSLRELLTLILRGAPRRIMALLTMPSTSSTLARRLSSLSMWVVRPRGFRRAMRSIMRRLGSIRLRALMVKPTAMPARPQRWRAAAAAAAARPASALLLSPADPTADGSALRSGDSAASWPPPPPGDWASSPSRSSSVLGISITARCVVSAWLAFMRDMASSSAFFAARACCRHWLTALAAPIPRTVRNAPASRSFSSSAAFLASSSSSFFLRALSRSSIVIQRHFAAAIAASGVMWTSVKPEAASWAGIALRTDSMNWLTQ